MSSLFCRDPVRSRPRGLMTFAVPSLDLGRVRPRFRLPRLLRDAVRAPPRRRRVVDGRVGRHRSGIERGADVVREGRSLFSDRPTPPSPYWPGEPIEFGPAQASAGPRGRPARLGGPPPSCRWLIGAGAAREGRGGTAQASRPAWSFRAARQARTERSCIGIALSACRRHPTPVHRLRNATVGPLRVQPSGSAEEQRWFASAPEAPKAACPLPAGPRHGCEPWRAASMSAHEVGGDAGAVSLLRPPTAASRPTQLFRCQPRTGFRGKPTKDGCGNRL